jgi:hypothetical protein
MPFLVRFELEGLTKGLEYNPKEGLSSRCFKDLPCAKYEFAMALQK